MSQLPYASESVANTLFALRSPMDIWSTEPSLFCFEWCTWLINMLLFIHAKHNGGKYMMAYVINMVGGAFLDPFCLLSPQINNYWHSQATVMLYYAREPVYQTPLITNVPYMAIVTLWSLGTDRTSKALHALAAGVVSIVSWHAVDVVGVAMLWWTWHAHDPLYAQRAQHVPVASTFWIFAWTVAVAVVCNTCYGMWSKLNSVVCAIVTIVLSWVVVPTIMTLCFVLVYDPLTGRLGIPANRVCIGLEVVISCAYLVFAKVKVQDVRAQSWLTCALIVHFVSLLAISTLYSPENVKQWTLHQPWGESDAMCTEMESYYWGTMKRKRYVCDDVVTAHPHMRLCDGDLPSAGASWYPLCGVALDWAWTKGVYLQVVPGLFAYWYLRTQQRTTTRNSLKKRR